MRYGHISDKKNFMANLVTFFEFRTKERKKKNQTNSQLISLKI